MIYIQSLWECICIIWEGYQSTNINYGETGLDGCGNVEKGEDEKDLIKSSVSFVSFS